MVGPSFRTRAMSLSSSLSYTSSQACHARNANDRAASSDIHPNAGAAVVHARAAASKRIAVFMTNFIVLRQVF